ncbi:MAG: carbamoyltransferase HypF [Desulfobulbus sp.]|nr:carbamoyltransferase HypF [Desulfobulbus sp.]
MHPAPIKTIALCIHVRGIVQGVGFRPFVYRLAHEWNLAGTVINDGDGVEIYLAGAEAELQSFVNRLRLEAPPAARIVHLDVQPTEVAPEIDSFSILPSRSSQRASTQIAPDMACCSDCLAEIGDPADRRYRYPFTNCTNCGPRFSIVEHIPYDRPNTSMRAFVLCESCNREYNDPLDRRFHAQPNACSICGPQLSWHDGSGAVIDGDCLQHCAQALSTGRVVAIKGLGGFHLAVNGADEAAVGLLRERKHRPAKPLAIMVRDLERAKRFCRISEAEAKLLQSPEHPIVLVDRSRGGVIADSVAPGLDVIGLMLPYTPLHHLLLSETDAPEILVMTSGNRGGEPICTGNEEALRRLHGLADFFLLHNRDIVTRVDDSVARIMDGKVRLLRRARGYSPVPILLNQPTDDILACGGEMKNSFCIVRGQEAYLSQHIGELVNTESFVFYRESIHHLQAVLELVPERVACDLHPDYLSTRYARGRSQDCRMVQHHHAHVGAVLAEQQLKGPVLGVILDGTGYGIDGSIFGGEIYQADRSMFTRRGHLAGLDLPGGDRATQEPWRMALSLLYSHLGAEALKAENQPPALHGVAEAKKQLLGQMLVKKVNCPSTSSCGRLFDGISALVGLCLVSQYEGQAAMLLEQQAMQAEDAPAIGRYPVDCRSMDNQMVIHSRGLVAELLADIGKGTPIPVMARAFHLWLVDAFVHSLVQLRDTTCLDQVVLAGGCMQNRLLFERLSRSLREHGFAVHGGEMVPMNDGGLALGQAYIGGFSCV